MTDEYQDKLIACPQCGEKAYLYISFSHTKRDTIEMRIKCFNCSRRGPLARTREGAMQLWNSDSLDLIDQKERENAKKQKKIG